MTETTASDEQERTSALSGQRRQVTVLFADMAGYTALAEKLGEEQTYLLMQQVHKGLSEAVHAHEGTVQEMTGDGIMALFGAPIAIEDAPLRACQAAVDIQTRMAAVAKGFQAKHGTAPYFRVGIHSGTLIVGEVGDAQQSGVTAMGDTVNLASRLESEAEAGTILLSSATQALVEGFVDCEFLGERTIKGKSEPQPLWRLDGIREGVTRFDISKGHGLSPLVGRQRELEKLLGLWQEASSGNLRAVCIRGEAGIGKSRLCFELRNNIADNKIIFLECHCAADTRETPFAPLMELVRRSFRIEMDASRDETERRLNQGLEILGIAPDQTLPYLMNLLGHRPTGVDLDQIAGEALGIRTRDAVIEMLREGCRVTPTILLVEDLRWIDSATQALLTRVIEDEEDLALFVIATARSGYEPPWAEAEGATFLNLGNLSSAETEGLLQGRLDCQTLPNGLSQVVSEKSQGNPLFAEEILAYLRSSGALDGEGPDLTFNRQQAGAALPVAIENLVMDRFDKLDNGPRGVLEAAAAIGTRFSTELLTRVTGQGSETGPETTNHLELLIAQGLIQAEAGGRAYSFCQTLARDAIFDSLLSARRQTLHGAIAKAIEGQDNFAPGDAADTLAYHWSRSAEPGRAVKYLSIAGENGLRIYSLEEAQNYLQQALTLIDENPGCVDDTALADILLHMARVLYFQYNFKALIELVEPYLDRVAALGDNRRLSRFLFEIGYANVFASNIETGREYLSRSRALGEADNDELAIAYADLGSMWDRMFWGQPGVARDEAQREAGKRIMEVGQRHGDTWLASKAGLANGLDLAGWGHPRESRAALMDLIALSRKTNDPRPRSMGQWALAAQRIFSSDYTEAIEMADDALRISLSPIDRAAANLYKGMAMVASGEMVDAGMDILEREILAADANWVTIDTPPVKMGIGVGMVMQGNMAAGVRAIETTAREAEKNGVVGMRTMGDQFLGQVYLQFALGGETPPLSVLMSNASFLLTTLPFAKKKARKYLQRALEGYCALDVPASAAQCHHDLGLLERAAKNNAKARASFELARDIASDVGADNIVRDAEAALANLSA
jgi:class 3 adenylate cyclase